MSAPVSNNNLTAEVCPFMAASINGDIPNLLPVLYIIHTVTCNTSIYMYYEIELDTKTITITG